MHKKQGWLNKEGHFRKNWKRRYFVVSEKYLTYYTDETQEDEKGCIFLPGSSIKELTLVDTGKPYCFKISWRNKYINLQADGGDDMKEWINTLSEYLNEKIIISGVLEKKSRGKNTSWRNWKKRYFALSCDRLDYFDPSSFEPLGFFPIDKDTLIYESENEDIKDDEGNILSNVHSRGETYVGMVIISGDEELTIRLPKKHYEQMKIWKQSILNVIMAGIYSPQVWGDKEFSI